MFAYVRLCSPNGKKNVERKPNGKRPEATEDTEVTEDTGFGENDGDREDASTLRSRATAGDGLPPGLGNRPIEGAARGHLGAAHGHQWELQNARQADHGGSRLRQIKAN